MKKEAKDKAAKDKAAKAKKADNGDLPENDNDKDEETGSPLWF